MNTGAVVRKEPTTSVWIAATSVLIVLWFVLYDLLAPLSAWTVSLLPLAPTGRLAGAATFFIYETPKVLMLLTLVVFAMGVVRSFFSPERTRALLIIAGKRAQQQRGRPHQVGVQASQDFQTAEKPRQAMFDNQQIQSLAIQSMVQFVGVFGTEWN